MWCQVQATSAISGQGCPLVRSKHAMCSSSDGRIYLYGGKSLLNQTLRDLWRFDPDENLWEQLHNRNNEICFNKSSVSGHTPAAPSQICQTCKSSNNPEWQNNHHQSALSSWDVINDAPPPLQEHTILGYKNKLYVFGGEIGYSSDETPLWIFDLETFVWKKFSTTPTQTMNAVSRPLGRRGHSAVVYKNIMCIYGGYQDIKGSTSEIWTFNLDTEEWYLEGNNFKKDACPLSRHGHSAVVYKDFMYVYGGMSNLNVRGDFWTWNFKTKEWNRVKTNRNPGVLSFHSAIVVFDSMFIYGGERSNGNHTNELWRYRFANQTWEHIEIKGIAPSCRTRHVAVANPFLRELENNNNHVEQWQQRACKKQNNNTIKMENKVKRHRNHCKEKKQTTGTNGFAKSTESSDNIKSISMCFNYQTDKSPSIFSLNESQTKVEKNKLNSDIENSQDVNNSIEKQVTNSANQKNEAPNNILISDQENNPNILNNVNKSEETAVCTTQTVRMRPRRPLLQKQRPYSDFYDTNILQNKDDFDFNELNETQFKRRSVQESMSYYSLCFSTPPAHLKQKTSPSIVLISPAIGPIDCSISQNTASPKTLFDAQESGKVNEENETYFDGNYSVVAAANQFAVKRRENFVSKRRLQKADLDLSELSSLAMHNPPKNGFSTLYSLTLDISPDFEKELKFSSNSTPSNEPNSVSMEHYEYESMEMTHLDMLEDYLEPEEMLEIVTESTNGEEISSSLNIKTIPRTPAKKKNNPEENNNDNSSKEDKVQHQSSAASVSNSSSGYQSLILTDSNVNSFDIISNPSISNSSSFGDQQHGKKEIDFDNLSAQKLVSKLSDSLQDNHFKAESIEIKQISSVTSDSQSFKNEIRTKEVDTRTKMQETKPRSSHFNRLSHWEPNIKEVIEEVAIPGSPLALHDSPFSSDDDDSDAEFNELNLNLIDDSFVYSRDKTEHDHRQHPIFCMYVFGGKEDCITGVLNKQSMTIWKYYT